MRKEKILFIWGRDYLGKLFTMPFGLNVLYFLLKDGYEVEIYLLENYSDKYEEILPTKPKINFIGNLLRGNYNRVKYLRIKLELLTKFNCKNIIAIGQMGAAAANSIFGKNKNIAYFNDEFPSIFKNKFLANREIELIKRASIVALPDFCRLAGLEEDIKFKIEQKKVVEFINSPCWINANHIKKVDWHSKLGIDYSKKIVLFSGGLGPALQVTEMLTSVKLWPEDFILVMNSSNLKGLEALRKSLPHLDIADKIIWLDSELSEDDFHSLIASSFCNICLYSNLNSNLFTVGKSSGKAMRSLLLGVPVICSDFPSFDFIKKNKLGSCIVHPLELADALNYLKENQIEIIENCKNYAATQIDNFKEYSIFIEKYLTANN